MIRPSPFHIKTTRSTVDTTEEQGPAGLVVIHNNDPQDHPVIRGIVEEVGSYAAEHLSDVSVGDVLFYLHAFRLADHDFVTVEEVIAWEESQ